MAHIENSVELPIIFHLKWVAKIALSVAAVAGIGLLLALFVITDSKGEGYGRIIFASNLTHENLGAAILVFALVLAIMASLMTWLISLYSSSRIAGPLFRFAENLKGAIENPLARPIAIRQTDMIQREWVEFQASQAKLAEHYHSLRDALHHANQTLSADVNATRSATRKAVARLVEIERLVQL